MCGVRGTRSGWPRRDAGEEDLECAGEESLEGWLEEGAQAQCGGPGDCGCGQERAKVSSGGGTGAVSGGQQ